jgi:hypothetical protein
MEPSENNSGMAERNALFKIDHNKANNFRPNGVTFFGRLMHELVSCETGNIFIRYSNRVHFRYSKKLVLNDKIALGDDNPF